MARNLPACRRDLLGRHLVLIDLLVDVQRPQLARLVVGLFDGVRVNIAEVHADVRLQLEPQPVLLGNRLDAQRLENRAALAGRNAQIGMLICARVAHFQLLRALDECRSEPCGRDHRIVAVMNKNALAGVYCPLVHPVICAFRRVIGADAERSLAAANRGIQHVLNFALACKLVEFFKPDIFEIFSERQLDGFDFLRLVQALENNLLPRPLVDDLHRADGHSPVFAQPQHVDRPLHLLKDAAAQCISDLAQHQRAGILVMLQSRADAEACRRGLHAAASAAQERLGIFAGAIEQQA